MVKQEMCLDCKSTLYLVKSGDSVIVIPIWSSSFVPLLHSSSKNSKDYVFTLHMSGNIYLYIFVHITYKVPLLQIPLTLLSAGSHLM